MLSRAELRVLAENVLRGVVIVLLAALLWQSLRTRQPVQQEINVRDLAGALPRWTMMPRAPAHINVVLDSVPSALERDWLRALAHSGSRLTWSGNLPAMMIAAQPVASPVGGVRTRVAAPSGLPVVVGDDVSDVDTVTAANDGAQLVLNSWTDSLKARVNGSKAATMMRDSLRLGKVLVIGEAGWESKFVIAALEEQGWKLDAFIRVSPDVDVTQGPVAAIDTSRYSAVIALDAAAAPYAASITEFVRSGGGVVLEPAAAALDRFAMLRSGSAGRPSSVGGVIQTSGAVSLATLPLAPVGSLRGDAVALEKRGGSVAVAARRVVAGRALQIGYEDSWRWRMGGGVTAVRDHRAWWNGLLSSVAYASRIPLAREASVAPDDAPLASLVAAVGPAASGTGLVKHSVNQTDLARWIFVLLSFALIAEIASRRLRGAR